MDDENVIAVDIGSTWTKAARFTVEGQRLVRVLSSSVPTTADRLADGFHAAVRELRARETGRDRPGAWPVFCSSSAKGGLSVAAVGIVPELTLKMARQTALSAGARIARVFSYALTAADRAALDALDPDIVLFSGGTDGGNTEFVEKNTAVLKELTVRPSIVFAGNRIMADHVARELASFPVYVTENILPDLNTPNPEPARATIREIFIDSITLGKGLDQVARSVSAPILPTPMVVFDFVRVISETVADWKRFCLVDIGGATTDVYSTGNADVDSERVVRKGPPEPLVRRTVEGDLGLRASAAAVIESREPYLRRLCVDDETWVRLSGYTRSLTNTPGYVSTSEPETTWDRFIAGACMTGALERHAGRLSEVFTPDGGVRIQTGPSLRATRKLVLSGGYLCGVPIASFTAQLEFPRVDSTGSSLLLPTAWEFYQDGEIATPLLANLSRRYPGIAAYTAVESWCGEPRRKEEAV